MLGKPQGTEFNMPHHCLTSWSLKYIDFHCESPRGVCNMWHLLKAFNQKISPLPQRTLHIGIFSVTGMQRLYLFNFYFWTHEAEFVSLYCHKSGVLWIWNTGTDHSKPFNESCHMEPKPSFHSFRHSLAEAGLWWDTRRPEGTCELHDTFHALMSFIKWLRNDMQF